MERILVDQIVVFHHVIPIPQSDERVRLSHSTNIGCKIDDQSWLHLFLRLPKLELILPQRYYPLQSIENRKLIEEVFKIYINCHEDKTPLLKRTEKMICLKPWLLWVLLVPQTGRKTAFFKWLHQITVLNVLTALQHKNLNLSPYL